MDRHRTPSKRKLPRHPRYSRQPIDHDKLLEGLASILSRRRPLTVSIDPRDLLTALNIIRDAGVTVKRQAQNGKRAKLWLSPPDKPLTDPLDAYLSGLPEYRDEIPAILLPPPSEPVKRKPGKKPGRKPKKKPR